LYFPRLHLLPLLPVALGILVAGWVLRPLWQLEKFLNDGVFYVCGNG
jgi:hypothetical protein